MGQKVTFSFDWDLTGKSVKTVIRFTYAPEGVNITEMQQSPANGAEVANHFDDKQRYFYLKKQSNP